MSVLPIVTYNDSVLREKTKEITENSPELQQLIEDMFETMYNASGVGLAGPQIGESRAIFVIDPDSMFDDDEEKPGKMTFINPKIVNHSADTVEYEEGCLSIPDIREPVRRPDKITITFLDKDFEEQTLEADGWLSRVIQHEYDHLQGKLFIDHLGSFRRRLLKTRLTSIMKGFVETDYPLLEKQEN